MTQRNLNRLSNLMLWLNFAAILSIATQILFISQYINQNQLSYQFLTRLKRIPASPTSIFWQCTVFSLALIFLITIFFILLPPAEMLDISAFILKYGYFNTIRKKKS